MVGKHSSKDILIDSFQLAGKETGKLGKHSLTKLRGLLEQKRDVFSYTKEITEVTAGN